MEWPVPEGSRAHAGTRAGWRSPPPVGDLGTAAAWTQPPAREHRHEETIREGRPVEARRRGPYTQAPPRDLGARAAHADAPARERRALAPFRDAPARHREPRSPWTRPTHRPHTASSPWHRGNPRDLHSREPVRPLPFRTQDRRVPHAHARGSDRSVREAIAPARIADRRPRAGFGAYNPRDSEHPVEWGHRPQQRIWVPPVRDYPDAAALRFNLQGRKVEPPRAMAPPGTTPTEDGPLVVENTVTAHRIDSDGEPDEALTLGAVTISTDLDSWCWDLTAETRDPASARKVAPRSGEAPAEVEVTVNGRPWRFIVESARITRDAEGESRRLEGRSPTALLAEPHAPPTSRTGHSRQGIDELARAAVTVYGETPFDVEWDLPTWAAPADTHTFQDRKPMQALQALARGLGVALHTPPEGDRLIVHRRAPRPVHLWQSVDDVRRVPAAYVTGADAQWEDDPRAAIAWVHGTGRRGVIVRGYRSEWDREDGEPRATSPRSSPVITTREAGRERARALLDSTGPRLIETLTMPLADEVGLFEPGELIRLYDGVAEITGLVRSTTVTARGSITQRIEVEWRPETYQRDESQIAPWEPPPSDELVMDAAEDDIYLHREGYWHIRPESGPRDAYTRTPDKGQR